jgi:hypothetical protein
MKPKIRQTNVPTVMVEVCFMTFLNIFNANSREFIPLLVIKE